MSKIYLAGRYSLRSELKAVADGLRLEGHVVTSRWLEGGHELTPEQMAVEEASDSMPPSAQVFALEDREDVRDCNTLVAFTEAPGARYSRGGRHVELGMAIGWGKRVIVVGPAENIFHTLPQRLSAWTSRQTRLCRGRRWTGCSSCWQAWRDDGRNSYRHNDLPKVWGPAQGSR